MKLIKMSEYLQKLCVYQLRDMYGKCSTIRLTDIDQSPPVLPDIWTYDFCVYVFHRSLRPIGVNLKQLHIDINAGWPYNLKSYEIDFNPIDVIDQDLRYKFITYTNSVNNTIPLYLYLTSNDSFYLSLNSEIPDGMIRAFNPSVYVLRTPYDHFECIGGVAMPTQKTTGKDIYEVLKTCKIEDFTDDIKPIPPLLTAKMVEKREQIIINSTYGLVIFLSIILSMLVIKSLYK